MIDNVNSPAHYNRDNAMECIEEMEKIFGEEAVKSFCLLNVWKYRYRAGQKDGEDGAKDLAKSDWYMKAYADRNKPKLVKTYEGCEHCIHDGKDEHEYPCSDCKHGHIDRFCKK